MSTALQTSTRPRILGRWMLTFAGFPLGAVAAGLVAGPVDGPGPALLGGLVTGAVLGLAQGWALRSGARCTALWSAVTAAGLGVGLVAGAGLVGFGTGLGDLACQGAVSGLAVGIAQAAMLAPRAGRRALLWPPLLAAAWALGWIVTTAIGVEVGDRFTVFGSSGALVVTVITAVLPLSRTR